LNPQKKNLQYSYRLYLNASGQRVLGKGGAQILETIDKYGSISDAARKLGMSYKFVWDYLTRMRDILGEPVISTHRGGTSRRNKKGGGGTALTPLARALLKEYRTTDALLSHALYTKKRTITLPRTDVGRGRNRRPERKT
jgi:molybdate transport system regulatory protein